MHFSCLCEDIINSPIINDTEFDLFSTAENIENNREPHCTACNTPLHPLDVAEIDKEISTSHKHQNICSSCYTVCEVMNTEQVECGKYFHTSCLEKIILGRASSPTNRNIPNTSICPVCGEYDNKIWEFRENLENIIEQFGEEADTTKSTHVVTSFLDEICNNPISQIKHNSKYLEEGKELSEISHLKEKGVLRLILNELKEVPRESKNEIPDPSLINCDHCKKKGRKPIGGLKEQINSEIILSLDCCNAHIHISCLAHGAHIINESVYPCCLKCKEYIFQPNIRRTIVNYFEEINNCGICDTTIYIDKCSLSCSHIFHLICLCSVLQQTALGVGVEKSHSEYNSKCPTCHTPINTQESSRKARGTKTQLNIYISQLRIRREEYLELVSKYFRKSPDPDICAPTVRLPCCKISTPGRFLFSDFVYRLPYLSMPILHPPQEQIRYACPFCHKDISIDIIHNITYPNNISEINKEWREIVKCSSCLKHRKGEILQLETNCSHFVCSQCALSKSKKIMDGEGGGFRGRRSSMGAGSYNYYLRCQICNSDAQIELMHLSSGAHLFFKHLNLVIGIYIQNLFIIDLGGKAHGRKMNQGEIDLANRFIALKDSYAN